MAIKVFKNKTTGAYTDKYGNPTDSLGNKLSTAKSTSTKQSTTSSLPSLSGTADASRKANATAPTVSSGATVSSNQSVRASSATKPTGTSTATTTPTTTTAQTTSDLAASTATGNTATTDAASAATSKVPSASVQKQVDLLKKAIAAHPNDTKENEYRQNKINQLLGIAGAATATTSGTATETAASTEPKAVQDQIDSINAQSAADINEVKALTDAQVNAETDYADAMTKLANEKYAQETQRLEEYKQLQDEILALRNESISATAKAQKDVAKAAYEASVREQELQRQRTEEAYNQQLIDQEVSNTKRTLEMESFIAATGGFGSLIKQKQIMETTLNNDRLINSIKFQKDMADREITNEIVDITDNYRTNIQTIEAQKQDMINSAYEQYLTYVDQINANEDMAEDERVAAITTAKADYKKNIAQINSDSFNLRYSISQTAANQVLALKNRVVDANVSAMVGFVADSSGRAILDEYGQKQSYQAPAEGGNFRYISPTVDAYGQVVSVGGVFDQNTGSFYPDSPLGISASERKTGGGGYLGENSRQAVDAIFGSGSHGGECGTWASTISTAAKVGDTWSTKRNAIDKYDSPKVGDKLLLPIGATDENGGTGHVEVVLSYDEATGDILTIGANWRNDGIIHTGNFNLYDLQDKYGKTGFGFASGELKEPYKGQVEALYQTSGMERTTSVADLKQLGVTLGYIDEKDNANFVKMALDGVILPDKNAAKEALTTAQKIQLNQQVRNSLEYKALEVAANKAGNAIAAFEREYRKQMEDSNKLLGGKNVIGAGSSDLSAAYQDMQLRLKDYYGLGALTGPDVVALAGLIPNPASIFSGVYFKDGSNAVLEPLEDLKQKYLESVTIQHDALYAGFSEYAEDLDSMQAADLYYESATRYLTAADEQLEDEVSAVPQ